MRKNKSQNFLFEGTYRVQSSKSPFVSKLKGNWFTPEAARLSREDINRVLIKCPEFLGKAKVTLRAARIEKRTGAFALHADALYYHRFFSSRDGFPAMEADILDVPKLAAHWKRRNRFLRKLFFGGQHEILSGNINCLEQAATNEYMCHEGGHLLGIDVHTKYDAGYFRFGGRLSWALTYVEEFRADLESFSIALKALSPENACEIFFYHLCHRFGLACESAQKNCGSAGAVPYLLFHLLRKLDVLEVKQDKIGKFIRLKNFSPKDVIKTMRACAEHASEFLTMPEMTAGSLPDAAIVGAKYFRERALDESLLNEFWHLVSGARSKQKVI